jgi:hypothetical protein
VKTNHENAKRVRVKYRGENFYFIHIFYDDGSIKAIDLNQSSDRHCTEETDSGLAMTEKLVNLLLKNGQVYDLVELMKESSRGKRTLPGIIYEQLAGYVDC